MANELRKFERYYHEQNKGLYDRVKLGQRLDWQHYLGTVSLQGHFTPGSKEIKVTLYQAIVLLLFNDAPTLSFRDIKSRTGLGMLLWVNHPYIQL